jgi:hypothetical protein
MGILFIIKGPSLFKKQKREIKNRPRISRAKWVQTSRGIYDFTALPSRFLTLRIIFDFKTSF